MLYITLFHQMENLAILASARKVNDYENMFRQELENISATVSALACAAKPKKRTPNPDPKPKKYTFNLHVPVLINQDEFIKIKMGKIDH